MIDISCFFFSIYIRVIDISLERARLFGLLDLVCFLPLCYFPFLVAFLLPFPTFFCCGCVLVFGCVAKFCLAFPSPYLTRQNG